jgi:formate dehydrogenase
MKGVDRNSDRPVRQLQTFCRLCEAQCGLLASVQGNHIVKIEPNPAHVLSQGHVCIKASAAAEIIDDPDRIRAPMRRTGSAGEFEETSWEQALADIGERLTSLRKRRGNNSLATFIGNPNAFHWRLQSWMGPFTKGMGIDWNYGINSEDGASRVMASNILFGIGDFLTPDLWRTDLAILIGTNPYISHGSTIVEPRIRYALKSIVDRGGRVIVVDPRRTETAKAFEHIGVRPGSDPYFLLGMVLVLFEEELIDRASLEDIVDDLDGFQQLISAFDLDICATNCSVPADVIRNLTRAFAAAPSALIHGRVGTCTQKFSTLANMLQDIVVVLTGNIEKAGGLVFGGRTAASEISGDEHAPVEYGKRPSRVRGHPDVYGLLPSTSFVSDVMTPGDGQVRALVSIATNPVLTSVGGGAEMEAALEELELFVSLDLYMNETNRHADYLLPAMSFYERDDFVTLATSMLRPAIWYSPAIVDAPPEVRRDEEILKAIAASVGVTITADPEAGIKEMLRAPWITAVREEEPLTVERLKTELRNGAMLRADLPLRRVSDWIRTPSRRIMLATNEMRSELLRLAEDVPDQEFPMRMIGLREIKSLNSWLHNVESTMPESREYRVRISTQDAHGLGIADGDMVTIVSKAGRVTAPVRATSDLPPGTIAVPHGWGHNGGWRRANAAGGINANILASGAVEDIEALAGASVTNGIPVRIETTVS